MIRQVLAVFCVLCAVPSFADPSGDQPGAKFKPYGSARLGDDPLNATNEVVSVDRRTGRGGLERKLADHLKIRQLKDQLGLKYLFTGARTCMGGAPRITLTVSTTGDKKDAHDVFGYVGDKEHDGGCPAGKWIYEDMTNEARKWDLAQFGVSAPSLLTWSEVVEYFENFPNHEVMIGRLDDDGFWAPTGQGCAYYDVVSVGARTFSNREDMDGQGDKKANACP